MNTKFNHYISKFKYNENNEITDAFVHVLNEDPEIYYLYGCWWSKENIDYYIKVFNQTFCFVKINGDEFIEIEEVTF